VDQLPSQTELPADIRFTHRQDAGRWLVGGSGGVLAVVAGGSVERSVRCPDTSVDFLHATGHFDDLLVAVGESPHEAPCLWAMAARRWLKPLPLPGVAYVAKLLRLDDSRWILCGRLTEGGGFAAIYTPLNWETTFLLVPRTRALVAGCSEPARGLALVVGSQGVALRIEGDNVQSSVAEGAPDLTASAMDVLDREWVASLGSLWVRNAPRETAWRRVWHDAGWRAPFVSLMADEGMVVAMTADGGVVDGRAA
jgi:hypothetical protein